ncbi:hypothetical protein F5Y09DRAFT_310361 [Xylaria sp. FL1042]|nr:hypothetical protein F5Y09DRAFT_310361 [Xylaria sp. FL1042]
MQLSVETIVAIIALFVALPPIAMIFVQLFRRYRSQRLVQEECRETAELELQPMVRNPFTSPPSSQSATLSSPWRTTIRMVFEDGSRTQLFEVTRNQPSDEFIGSGSDVCLLADSQTADRNS